MATVPLMTSSMEELGGWGGGEDLGDVEGGKTLIRLHCMKRFFFFLIKKEFQKMKASFKMTIISLIPKISVSAARHCARR